MPRKLPPLPPHRATLAEKASFHQKPLFICGLQTFQTLTRDTRPSCFATLNWLWILGLRPQREHLSQKSQLHFWKNGPPAIEQQNCRVRLVGTPWSICAWRENRGCLQSEAICAADTLSAGRSRCLNFANLCGQPHEWNTQKAPRFAWRADKLSCEVHLGR